MGDQQGSLNETDLIPIPMLYDYYTDSIGNLFSTKRSSNARKLKQHLHKARGNKRYKRVKIAGKTQLVHRVIAQVLVSRQLTQLEVVNHIDGNTLNNQLSNLEVVSHRDNVRHAVQNGLYCSGREWYKARGYAGTQETFND
jgi:hypothetical protein